MIDLETTLKEDYQRAKYSEEYGKIKTVRLFATARKEYIAYLYKRAFDKDIEEKKP